MLLSLTVQKSVMSIYSDKLAHVQVVINCRNSIAQMCSREDTHARSFMRAVLDDFMSQNELTTFIIKFQNKIGCL